MIYNFWVWLGTYFSLAYACKIAKKLMEKTERLKSSKDEKQNMWGFFSNKAFLISCFLRTAGRSY